MAEAHDPAPLDLDPDRAPLLRSTVLAWQVSTVLLVLAAVLALAWLWIAVRTQQHLSSGGGFSFGDGGSGGPSFVERIDAGVGSISLLSSAGLIGALGLGLRMAGDLVGTRLREEQTAAPDSTIGPDTP